MLQRTRDRLNQVPLSSDVIDFARIYFKTGTTAIEPADLAEIKKRLEMVKVGLGGNLTIKIGTNVGRGDKPMNGVVAASTKAPTQPYHNQVINMVDNKLMRKGAMRLFQERILSDGVLGTKTLIHEATHKYAGTTDKCIFSDFNDTAPRANQTPLPDKAAGLMNADSYAYFVVKVGTPVQPTQ